MPLSSPIQESRIEQLFLLHQGPGDDQKLRCQLHPHLGADPFFPLTVPDLIRVIDDELFVVERADERRLIQCIPEIGLSFFRDDRRGAV